jgi:hypothetical protein
MHEAAGAGNRSTMSDDRDHREEELPTTNQPLHGEPRPRWWPLLAVLGLVVVIAVIVLFLTWVQQNH